MTFYREIAGDVITPVSVLINSFNRRDLFLLESANLDRSFSRFSFFGFNPEKIITFRSGTLEVRSTDGTVVREKQNPVDFMRDLLQAEEARCAVEYGDFPGGYVGFMGYDMVNYTDVLRDPVREDENTLLMAFFQVNEFYVFDNHCHKVFAALSIPVRGDLDAVYADAGKRTMEMASEITSAQAYAGSGPAASELSQDFSAEEFMEAVRNLKHEITRGECIQTVLSNRYEITGLSDPVSLYRLMRNINPSPYMFFIKTGDDILCGTSPETHLKVSGRKALLKPIAGTYRYDASRKNEILEGLRKDNKEVAEHLMLLDLARNDLYSGCSHESVRVNKSFEPEIYSHVVHLVSEVEGELEQDKQSFDLFCNTFPAGTVSGAPKVRAMELISQYEKSPRGFYAGCAGYFAYNQDIDTCIIIRSAFVSGEKAVLRAGAGIVYDSDPEKEYLEVNSKLGALFDSLKLINILEEQNVFAG
ncbi:MAG TPA: anthranilate synthase component I family protein [Spirochaetota bacterium]|mgnify:FL=1|nr:anthranilate synthase component I family protein [Spirochaetota bacterium]